MPFPFPKPSTEEGTHLSYSLQWFAFGILMFVGFGYAARQQARNAAIDAEDAEADAAAGGAVPALQRPAVGAVLLPASARTRRRKKRKTPSWTPRATDAVSHDAFPGPVANVKRALTALGAKDTVTVFDSKVPTAAAAAAALGCDVAAITNSLVFDLEGTPLLILASGAAKVDVQQGCRATGHGQDPPRLPRVRPGTHRPGSRRRSPGRPPGEDPDPVGRVAGSPPRALGRGG